MTALRLLSLSIALALAGCASVGPDFKPSVPAAPQDWTSWHGGKVSLLDASLAARDDIPGAAPLFADPALRRLIDQAMSANADLQTAALHHAQSRAQAGVTAATGGPQLNASAAVNRQRQSENGAQTRLVDVVAPGSADAIKRTLAQPYTQYQAGFDASWELDLWGRLARLNEAAGASAEANAFLLQQARISIASEVARAFVQLRGAQSESRLLKSEEDVASELLSLSRARRWRDRHR